MSGFPSAKPGPANFGSRPAHQSNTPGPAKPSQSSNSPAYQSGTPGQGTAWPSQAKSKQSSNTRAAHQSNLPGQGKGKDGGQSTVREITRDNYVDQAEKVMSQEIGRDSVTTSQLRNLLSLTADIYNRLEVSPANELPQDIKDSLLYLRVQFAYASGRNSAVKRFMEEANLESVLKTATATSADRDGALLLCRYLEALAAYKKYFDPSDK